MRFQEVRKLHEWVYKDFYGKFPLVLWGHFSFLWIPTWYGHRSKFLHTISKIPLDCLVGLRKIKGSNTFISDVISYNISSSYFDTYPFSDINKEQSQIECVINQFLKENGCSDFYEIGILSETTRWHSFGFSGTFSGILAMTLFYITGKITRETFWSYDDFLKSEIFSEIFKLAWKIELMSRYGNTLGPTIVWTMVDAGPIYLMSHEFDSSINIEILDEVPVVYHKMYEKFWENMISKELPLDYGMIFTGLSTNTKTIEEYQKGHTIKLNTFSDFLEDDILSDIPGRANVYFSKFAKNDSIYNHFCDNLSILNIEVVYLFKQLLASGFENDLLNQFIEVFNNYRHIASLVEKQSPFAFYLKNAFENHAKNPDERIGIMPVYSGKMGGGYMFVMKPNISRNTLETALNEIREFYPDAAIEYASYLDGEGVGGINLMQDVENNLYASILAKNGMYIYSNIEGVVKTWNFHELVEFGTEWLLLDCVNEKIYWNGQWVTSKDIKSQSTTIQLLDLLLTRIGTEIQSNQLPSSSYTKSKTEMIGKITAPLMNFIYEKSGEKLDIQYSGGLSSFAICMEKPLIKIGFIKKIFK